MEKADLEYLKELIDLLRENKIYVFSSPNLSFTIDREVPEPKKEKENIEPDIYDHNSWRKQ